MSSKKPSKIKKSSQPAKKKEPLKRVSPFLDQNTYEGVLINFDKRTKLFIGILVFLFLGSVAMKLHTSSISIWNEMFELEGTGEPKDQIWGKVARKQMSNSYRKNKDVIWGTPRFIRMDEWTVQSPSILSQYLNDFPKENPTVGGESSPLLMGLPYKDVSMAFRPQMWGYFTLDIERAFSYYWNFKAFIQLLGSFLFFMLVTRNKFWLSVCGAFWIYLSSPLQWWMSTAQAELIGFGSLMFISACYLIYSQTNWVPILHGILLIVFSYSFATIFYPAWQVPYAYLLLVLFIGYIIKYGNKDLAKTNIPIKLISTGLFGGIFLFLVYRFFIDASATLDLVLNTIYPGQRSYFGGELKRTKMFSENFGWLISENKHPNIWGNICEASSYFMIFPVVLYGLVKDVITKKKMDLTLIMVSAFLLFMFVWMFFGLPEFISKITLFDKTTSRRLLVIFGITNVILAILYLSNRLERNEAFRMKDLLIFAICSFGFIWFVNSNILDASEAFFNSGQVIKASLLVVILYVLFEFRFPFSTTLFFAVLLIYSSRNLGVNPLSQGLPTLFESKYAPIVEKAKETNPDSKWIVFGEHRYANFFKSLGVNVVNGVKYAPDFDLLSKLDPDTLYMDSYNRYAHVIAYPYVDQKDSSFFQGGGPEADGYALFIDPCSPKLKEIGVEYMVFSYEPNPVETRCMELVYADKLKIYKVKNDSEQVKVDEN